MAAKSRVALSFAWSSLFVVAVPAGAAPDDGWQRVEMTHFSISMPPLSPLTSVDAHGPPGHRAIHRTRGAYEDGATFVVMDGYWVSSPPDDLPTIRDMLLTKTEDDYCRSAPKPIAKKVSSHGWHGFQLTCMVMDGDIRAMSMWLGPSGTFTLMADDATAAQAKRFFGSFKWTD